MNGYDLVYKKPSFVWAKYGGGNVQYTERIFHFEAETDEQAIAEAKIFLAKPGMEIPGTDIGFYRGQEMNVPIKLTKIVAVESWKA